MRKTGVAVLLCLLVVSCKHLSVFKEVQSGNGLFTMSVPTYMHASNDILPGVTVMQYVSDSASLNMLVFDTSRNGLNEKTLKAYYDSAVSQPNLQNAKIDSPKFLMLNGDSAYSTTMTGLLNDTAMYYRIEVIATKTHFFDILLWTKASKVKGLQEDIEKIMNSFTDINHKKV